MIVSVCSAFWLFLREIVLIDAKSGGKATVCFSIMMRNLFGEQQLHSLSDYIQAALMLNHAGREVA